MNAPSVTERLLALKTIAPFDRLADAELALIASAARARAFAPGETLLAAGKPAPYLFVVVEGEAREEGGAPVPPVLGADSLLFQSPLERTIRAGEAGAVCLLLGRAHFFTTVYECPALVIGLLRQPRSAAPPRAEASP